MPLAFPYFLLSKSYLEGLSPTNKQAGYSCVIFGIDSHLLRPSLDSKCFIHPISYKLQQNKKRDYIDPLTFRAIDFLLHFYEFYVILIFAI